jgi:hypothetical protein
MIHAFTRVPARRLLDGVFPALEAAIEARRSDALAGVLDRKYFEQRHGSIPELRFDRGQPCFHTARAALSFAALIEGIVESVACEPTLHVDKAVSAFNGAIYESPEAPPAEADLWLSFTAGGHNMPSTLLPAGGDAPWSLASPSESRRLGAFLSSEVGEQRDSWLFEVLLLATRCKEDEGLACYVGS